jgi:membrane protein
MANTEGQFSERPDPRRFEATAPGEYREAGHKHGWGDLFKSVAALWVARSAERVMSRRAETAEAGRLGGEVHGATRVAPAARPRTAARPAVPEAATAKDAKAEPEDDPTYVPRRPLEIAKFVFKEFGKDNGSLMAAAVAFYLVLSIIPLIILGVAVIGFILEAMQRSSPNNEATNQVFRFVNQFMPINKSTIHGWIQKLVNERANIGIAGLAGVALTATGGFATLENAINVMWNRPNRNFIMNKLYAFMMMIIIGVLFGLSVGSTAAVQWAGKLPILAPVAQSGLLQVVGYVLPIVISGLMFATIYKVYPNGRSGWKPALTAGFITAVLWEVAKVAYTRYMAMGDQSPYGIVIALVMWIFYSATLVLMGSELTWVLEGCPDREGKEARHAQLGRQG